MDASGNEERVTATADSTGVFSVLYPVHDRFEALFDPRTFCSARITKHTEEGFRRLIPRSASTTARRKSVLQEKNLKTGASKQDENEIPGCVTDVVSGIFYLGSRPLQVGQTYTFPLNNGGKTNDVRARVEAGRTSRRRPAPSTLCGFSPKPPAAWSGAKAGSGSGIPMMPAISPVQMRARLLWGTLTLRLTRVEKK